MFRQQVENSENHVLPFIEGSGSIAGKAVPEMGYRHLLKLFGENDAMIGSLLAIQKTRLTINGFEKLLRVSAFQIGLPRTTDPNK